MLTLGSLFDGIGGWQLAAERAGVKPIWSSEIDPFPMAVTKKHFPKTKQLGDISGIDGAKIEPVDIVTCGSPCQDLSVANGRRKGLKGERSGLLMRAVDLIRVLRKSTMGGTAAILRVGERPRRIFQQQGTGFSSRAPVARKGRDSNASIFTMGECRNGQKPGM